MRINVIHLSCNTFIYFCIYYKNSIKTKMNHIWCRYRHLAYQCKRRPQIHHTRPASANKHGEIIIDDEHPISLDHLSHGHSSRQLSHKLRSFLTYPAKRGLHLLFASCCAEMRAIYFPFSPNNKIAKFVINVRTNSSPFRGYV